MDVLSIFFPAWWQIFLFALSLHPTAFSLDSQFLEGMLASSESLSIVAFLYLHKITCIFPKTFCEGTCVCLTTNYKLVFA